MRQDKNSEDSKEIQIAKLALIAAAITTLGDGLALVAAALSLELLENPETDTRNSSNNINVESTQSQLDYYIDELTRLRNSIR